MVFAERAVLCVMSYDLHDNNHSTLKNKTVNPDYAWVGVNSILVSGISVRK